MKKDNRYKYFWNTAIDISFLNVIRILKHTVLSISIKKIGLVSDMIAFDRLILVSML